MGRKRVIAVTDTPHKCAKKGKYMEKTDRISQLPDEVLISILSCLTLNEAAKTCLLSHRWEKLWTFSTGILNFDGTKTLEELGFGDIHGLNSRRSTFIDWVNQILKLHQGHSIDEFKVHFGLDSSSSGDINKWIDFALQKGVKRLHLDLRSCHRYFTAEKYTFPAVEKLTYAKQNTSPRLISCFHYLLTAIKLQDVNIAQEAIEHFLLNSPFLEQLSVIGSIVLVNLRVSGAKLKLKHLEISSCHHIRSIEISAANLKSFVYSGPKIFMLMENVPCLSQLSLGEDYSRLFIKQIRQHTSYLPQLETLSLQLYVEESWNRLKVPLEFPEFTNLTQLEITAIASNDPHVLWVTWLIVSCPFLHTLAIDLFSCGFGWGETFSWWELPCGDELLRNYRKTVEKATKSRHESLKVVKLKSFRGSRTEIDLASCILEMAVSLEKLIIDTEYGYADPRQHQALAELKAKLAFGAGIVIL